MKLTSLAVIAVALLSTVARGELPPFVEQDLLPAVDDRPTCACVVEGDDKDSDLLVVGFAGGYIMTLKRGGGRSAEPTPVQLAGRGSVGSAAAIRFPGGAGNGTVHAILAVQGPTVSAVSFERGEVMGSCQLPPPAGAYRLAALGIARAAAYDDASAWMLSLEGTSEGWGIRSECVLSDAERLRVTVSRDGSVTVLADDRMYGVTHTGAHALGDLPLGGLDTAGPLVCTERLAAGRDVNAQGALRLLVRADDGSWAAGSVPIPGPLTMLVAVSDSTVLAGGVTADTTGWVEIVDRRGVVPATGAHAVPPVHACVMDGCFVVHGADRNLTVFSHALESLWDQASRFITPVALLALDYDGDGFDDAALVGERLVRSRRSETDSLRKYLRKPDIMAGARLVRDAPTGIEWYEREETHAEVLLSRRDALAKATVALERAARDSLREGRDEAAIETLCEGRAAAAAIGDRDRVAKLTRVLGEWTSRGRRTRATAILAFVLGAAGLFYALGCARGAIRVRVTVMCAVALSAVAALGWRLFGFLAWTPLLAVGGLAPMATAAWRLAGRQAMGRPHPAAPIDELREAVAAFIHAVDDDLRSVGRLVSDAPRKTVTALAALAEDMRKSLDSPEQYQALLERVRVRGETLRKVVVPQLDHIVWLAKRARFLVPESKRMQDAGERIAAALDVILNDRDVDRAALDGVLRAIPDSRRELVAAADRAWEDLKANPGCSLLGVLEYVAGEKKEEMREAGVSFALTSELVAGKDAVRIAHHELYGILENLFTNATRATAGARKREIVVVIRSAGDVCHLRLGDSGRGMSNEQVSDVFAQTRGEVREGGTGLPQGRRTLRKYGGDITIEKTEVGRGTTILVAVPHWSPTIPFAESKGE